MLRTTVINLEADFSHDLRLRGSSRAIATRKSGNADPRMLFTYFGRRGLSEFVWHLAETVPTAKIAHAVFAISRQNDRIQDFRQLGDALEPVDTFRSDVGFLCAWRARRLRKQLIERIHRDRIDVVVSLMPHVWSGLISPAIRASGARLVSVVHDATPHPGDLRSSIRSRITSGFQDSDLVVTLSHHVADLLKSTGAVDPDRIRTLFHPDLNLGRVVRPSFPAAGEPFRLLFLGRILPYKSLDMLITAVESLRREGVNLQLGVFGEGALGADRARLHTIGAEVFNHWLGADEISVVLARYHAVALSHSEASQSGVAALAFGHGLPVVANPIGGLVEQIKDGVTGIMAASVDADALAAAIKHLAQNKAVYERLVARIRQSRGNRSMRDFADGLAAYITELRGNNDHQTDRARSSAIRMEFAHCT